jgi:hypothetical protein
MMVSIIYSETLWVLAVPCALPDSTDVFTEGPTLTSLPLVSLLPALEVTALLFQVALVLARVVRQKM